VKIRIKALVKGLSVIAILAGAGYLLKASGLHDLLDTAWIDSEIKGQGLYGELLFVGLGALGIALAVPRQVICFLGGYAFDFATGSLLSLLSSGLSCAGVFLYARFFGRNFVQAKFSGRVRKIDEFLHENPFAMSLLIRLLPVGSNLLTNVLAGVTSVALLPFLLGSLLGYIPQTLVFSLLGSGVQFDAEWRIAGSVALFLASAALGVHLFRRYRHGKELEDDVMENVEEDNK
jgi:uncharacterized membrane protein YdjX (TVP38/TMEM64 family)